MQAKKMTLEETTRSVVPLAEEVCRQRVAQLMFESMLESTGEEVHTEGSDRCRLTCPITLTRIKTPVRGHRCRHLQCYDLRAYVISNLRMGAFNKRWRCPVCNLHTRPPGDLFIDTHLLQVLTHTETDEAEIAFNRSGNWSVTGKVDTPASASSDMEDLPPPTPGGEDVEAAEQALFDASILAAQIGACVDDESDDAIIDVGGGRSISPVAAAISSTAVTHGMNGAQENRFRTGVDDGSGADAATIKAGTPPNGVDFEARGDLLATDIDEKTLRLSLTNRRRRHDEQLKESEQQVEVQAQPRQQHVSDLEQLRSQQHQQTQTQTVGQTKQQEQLLDEDREKPQRSKSNSPEKDRKDVRGGEENGKSFNVAKYPPVRRRRLIVQDSSSDRKGCRSRGRSRAQRARSQSSRREHVKTKKKKQKRIASKISVSSASVTTSSISIESLRSGHRRRRNKNTSRSRSPIDKNKKKRASKNRTKSQEKSKTTRRWRLRCSSSCSSSTCRSRCSHGSSLSSQNGVSTDKEQVMRSRNKRRSDRG
eukprot:TRINITY_DN14910_c0_g1_i1.p1 TRINITY_DN14910_c0_g1~~TRINITY_DN14910_c0_g1_i1.p1  ORF type:complete len:536 (-),score=105.44 TRINITY_DN14910_c0_g1_i1:96-1703(-)